MRPDTELEFQIHRAKWVTDELCDLRQQKSLLLYFLLLLLWYHGHPCSLDYSHTVHFLVLLNSKLTPASGPLYLLFPLPESLLPSSLHGHSILLSQVLSQLSFLQRLSLTTLMFLSYHSPNIYSCFIFSTCWLITLSFIEWKTLYSREKKKYINISGENFNAGSCMSCLS